MRVYGLNVPRSFQSFASQERSFVSETRGPLEQPPFFDGKRFRNFASRCRGVRTLHYGMRCHPNDRISERTAGEDRDEGETLASDTKQDAREVGRQIMLDARQTPLPVVERAFGSSRDRRGGLARSVWEQFPGARIVSRSRIPPHYLRCNKAHLASIVSNG